MTWSDSDDKNLEWLHEAFGSKISINDMASAYCQAGRDVEKANGILCNMLGSSSSTSMPLSIHDSTGALASSVGSADAQSELDGMVSGVNGASYARPGTLISEPPKILSRPKPRHSGASMGTVSGIIGAAYVRPRTSNTEVLERPKPVRLTSSEIPASEIWDEKRQPDDATSETMNKDVELLLLKMLGHGFQLDKKVIREVVGGCGYDVRESMEKLMTMSASALDLGCVSSSTVDQTYMETCPHLAVQSKEELQFRGSTGSDRLNLEKEVLKNLFTAPERLETGPRKIIPRREPRQKKYGVVIRPLEDRAMEFKTPIVKKEVHGDGNEEMEDNYDTLREAVIEYWTTMKKYYSAAADAFAKGNHELANKLVEEGYFFMAKARETKEMSVEKLTQDRDGETISIDLNDYEPKEAIRLLKSHLKSMCGIPSIHFLKVIVGKNDDKTKPNARKRLISKLLERDAISWTEEEDGKIMTVRIDVINPKHLSFNKR